MVEPLALSSFLATLISLSARLAFDIASLRSKYRSVPRELSYLEAECQILASLLANLKSTEPFAYEARNLRPVLCHLNQILIDTSALFGVFDRTPTFLMRIKWIMQKDELVYHRESLSSCLALFNATLISKMPLEQKRGPRKFTGTWLVKRFFLNGKKVGPGTLRIKREPFKMATLRIKLDEFGERTYLSHELGPRTEAVEQDEGCRVFIPLAQRHDTLNTPELFVLDILRARRIKGPRAPLTTIILACVVQP